MVEMVQVESSNVDAVGYDPAASELHVRFASGDTYVHKEVPPPLFGQFLIADSKGGFYAREIKGKFESKKVEGPACGFAIIWAGRIDCAWCKQPMHAVGSDKCRCDNPGCGNTGKLFEVPHQRVELVEAKT